MENMSEGKTVPGEKRSLWTSLNWRAVLFIGFAHLMALYALYHMSFVHFSFETLYLNLVWYVLSIFSVTGGSHRLYSHVTYKARQALHFFHVCFFAGTFQDTTKTWVCTHRPHHWFSDTERDPHDARKGFWWVHCGWIFVKYTEEQEKIREGVVKDLDENWLVSFQDKRYVYDTIAILFGFAFPTLIAWLWWDDAFGSFLFCFLRIVTQEHATFSVNSVAHYLGTRPYTKKSLARNAPWWWSIPFGIITLGEGPAHNRHHRFPNDYRNGSRWYHCDITAWLIFLCSKVGLAYDLKRVSREKELAVLENMRRSPVEV